jgi:glycosyltransferase involved in cell wall biosynthesis
MKFSLVQATLGRTEELARFLRELDRQTYRHFELIVVDQNPDQRIDPILAQYESRFPVFHVRSEKGLSRARNVGMRQIGGDVVAFPDDDCWYPPRLLESVKNLFASQPEWHGITGRPVSAEGQAVLGQYDSKPGLLTKLNVWRRVNSNTLFLRRHLVESVGWFDETLGVGAGTPWGSSEDADFPLRALNQGLRVYYLPDLLVFHPDDTRGCDIQARIRKAYSYGLGMGRVLRKHRYPTWFLLYNWTGPLRPLALALVCGRTAQAKVFWALSAGRVRGWLGWA